MVKTITVTEDAYQNIKLLKKEAESFSDLFNRIAAEKRNMVKEYFGVLKSTPEELRQRRKSIKAVRESIGEDGMARVRRLDARRKELGSCTS